MESIDPPQGFHNPHLQFQSTTSTTVSQQKTTTENTAPPEGPSQETLNAYNREIRDRCCRFSSKRPSYNTYADYLMEYKNGLIKIHPEDYARIKNDAILEARRIFNHNFFYERYGSRQVEVMTGDISRMKLDEFVALKSNTLKLNYDQATDKINTKAMLEANFLKYKGEGFYVRMQTPAKVAWGVFVPTAVVVLSSVGVFVYQMVSELLSVPTPPDLDSALKSAKIDIEKAYNEKQGIKTQKQYIGPHFMTHPVLNNCNIGTVR